MGQKWVKELKKNSSNLNNPENQYLDIENSKESTPVSLTIDETYKCMKSFKAEQRSIFYELMKHIAEKKNSTYKINNKNHLLCGSEISFKEFNSVDKLNTLFSLFRFKDKDKYKKGRWSKKKWFDYFIRLTKNNSQENSESRQENREKRGKLFLFGKHSYFAEYYDFCEKYKKIAQERGRLKAQLKGLEKEKLESSQTNYWSFIYVANNYKQLWLVPKNCIKDAKKFIYNTNGRQNSSKDDKQYLCCFESLTMRALHKLCFAEQSTFVQDMPDDLKILQKKAKEFKTAVGDKKKQEEKLKFLKELLKSDYFDINKEPKNKGLDVTNFNLDWVDSVNSLEEFEEHLEQSCYFIKTIKLSMDKKNKFLKDYQVTVLDITSYDLEGINKKNTPTTANRFHTDLWNSFWKNTKFNHKPETIENNRKENSHNSIRLNPEVKIYYRKADDKLKNYFNQKSFPDSFKHRKKQSQITIAFTLNLNAEGKHEELAFSKPDKELFGKIDVFNTNLNEDRDFKTAWKYGIDRNKNELATLCISRINQNSNKPEFRKFECLTLKDYKYSGEYRTKTGQSKTGEAIRNLSFFIDNENLFQKNHTSCLDLTTAKVIKNKLVSNGDVMTYLKLKKESSKRKLYDLYSKGKIKEGAKLKWSNNIDGYKDKYSLDSVLNIQLNNNTEKTIYHYYNRYKNILSQKVIENSLNSYLKELLDSNHSKHTPSIEKINHLRSAVTANMVGVICYLQKQYPGFIILEDLPEYHPLFNIDENITRKLENALYNKFQTASLVPPHIKNIIKLRENLRKAQKKSSNNVIKSSQIGIIVFVDETDTSKICPSCKKKNSQDTQSKLEQKRFRCVHCKFDTYLFKSQEEWVNNYKPEVKFEDKQKFELFKDLDDPDKVAAYNIAIKITDADQIGKWKNCLKNISEKKKEW